MIYNRATLEGIYLPRADLDGWQVDIGGESFSRANPGPISSVDLELDAIGCLTQATIALKAPRHPVFTPFSMPVKFWVKSKTLGLVPVALGFVGVATQDDLKSYTLNVRPLEELSAKDYYDGSIAQASGDLKQVGSYTQKNEEVITAALKDRPKASVGVDFNGQALIAEPSEGMPYKIPRSRFYAFKSTGVIVLPYGTRSRWDGGKGWAKGEYFGITRPPYAERRAIDAGEVTFKEIFAAAGPPVVARAEFIVNPYEDPDEKAQSLEGDPQAPATTATPTANLSKRTVTAQQYAMVVVYDLQAWYRGSSLPGQGANEEAVAAAQKNLSAAQIGYQAAYDVLGEGDSFTKEELAKMDYAKNMLRIARLGNSPVESYYEPLSAKLSMGFTLNGLSSPYTSGV